MAWAFVHCSLNYFGYYNSSSSSLLPRAQRDFYNYPSVLTCAKKHIHPYVTLFSAVRGCSLPSKHINYGFGSNNVQLRKELCSNAHSHISVSRRTKATIAAREFLTGNSNMGEKYINECLDLVIDVGASKTEQDKDRKREQA